MKRTRYEFSILTITIFCVGFILYGGMGIGTTFSDASVGGNMNPVLFCSLAACGGGYLFFSILSGVLFTAKWLSKKTFKIKVLMTIFFAIPVWIAMAGIFYSIPYGIFNFIQYRKLCGKTDSL